MTLASPGESGVASNGLDVKGTMVGVLVITITLVLRKSSIARNGENCPPFAYYLTKAIIAR